MAVASKVKAGVAKVAPITAAHVRSGEEIDADLERRLARLRAAYEAEPYPSAAVRKDRLGRGIDIVLRNEKRIVDALQADFGGRAEPTTLLADVMVPIRAMRYAKNRVERWRRLEKRKADFPLDPMAAPRVFSPLPLVGEGQTRKLA